MGKLHEVLAVEPDLKNKAQKAIARAKDIFASGGSQLLGIVRVYHTIIEGSEKLPDEVKKLPTTVDDEMEQVVGALGKWVDAAIQKEATNQNATADLEMDGEVLLADLPATALLNLEGKLTQLRSLMDDIPTNDPTKQWHFDEDLGHWVSETEVTYRTKKVPRSHVMYEATPEHPAQVEMYHEDIQVGRFENVYHSGMWSQQRKREILGRLDDLIVATRKARQRANTEEVVPIQVADTLFEYIMKG